MNTLTIAVLLVCATVAYVSAAPGENAPDAAPAAPAEILQGEEARWHGGGGGGGRYYNGGGRYHGGGDRYHGGGGGGRYRHY